MGSISHNSGPIGMPLQSLCTMFTWSIAVKSMIPSLSPALALVSLPPLCTMFARLGAGKSISLMWSPTLAVAFLPPPLIRSVVLGFCGWVVVELSEGGAGLIVWISSLVPLL